MKAAVITRHAISNYGSLLQAIATQQAVNDLGAECEIIDYIRDDEHYKEQEKTALRDKPNWNNNALKRAVYLALRQGETVHSGKVFRRWQKQYLTLTKNYRSLAELKADKPSADVYITGSDQVWGKIANDAYDPAYFLSFTDDSDRRCAYAASFGKAAFDDETLSEFRSLLSRYQKVTVRENRAKATVEKMGLCADIVLDPTLLYDKDYWSRLIEKEIEGDYILVYQIQNYPEISAFANELAQKTGLKLIRISGVLHQCTRGGKFVYLPTLGEFLSYIKNAKCVITNSFHATAFSINFNTPFIEVLHQSEATNSRNLSILEMTGLENRILTEENRNTLFDEPIDFTSVNQMLGVQREASFAQLKQILSE